MYRQAGRSQPIRVDIGTIGAFVIPALPESMDTDYLKRILTARVYDVAIETPLEAARA